jgi:hypothetical protein
MKNRPRKLPKLAWSERLLPELRRTAAVRVACQAHQRDRLERLCGYITRPALCLEGLSTHVAGRVICELKNPFHEGATRILFSPEDFISRLAAVVPHPRVDLIRYHGIFATSSPVRRAIVPTPANTRQRSKLKGSAVARQPGGAHPQNHAPTATMCRPHR